MRTGSRCTLDPREPFRLECERIDADRFDRRPRARDFGRSGPRSGSRGFTLIELVIVVAIIGILVTVAMPIYQGSVKKAREAVLAEDLWVMRDAIDQHFTDKGHYPADLNALVEAGYLKQLPVDPITNSADTWVTEDAEADDQNTTDQPAGIKNVKSGAPGNTVEGKAYGDL